ncbi:MAG: ribonuclease HI, partial [Caldilineae bacterium]
YTDGGCNPNPGPGGWAAILLFPGQKARELTGSHPNTTNNRMELQAAIEALRALPAPHRVTFYTDSEYLRRGITEWLPHWQTNGWRRGKGELKNRDLWEQLAEETRRHQIEWRWTRGHTGDRWNERADRLARSMIDAAALPLDDPNAVHIFAAGSYRGKTGGGGWAVILRYREAEKSLSGSAAGASSNRMHLQAAIEGLRALKKSLPVHLYTPSDYLKNGATRWLSGWRARNWKTKDGKPVSNRDLWEALAALLQTRRVRWHVVSKEAMPPPMQRARHLAAEAARAAS